MPIWILRLRYGGLLMVRCEATDAAILHSQFPKQISSVAPMAEPLTLAQVRERLTEWFE